MAISLLSLCTLLLVSGRACPAGGMPECLELGTAPTVEAAVASSKADDHELLARLVYAEAASTGFQDDPAVYEAIAWGVMNRVRLAAASASKRRIYGTGIRGVIFRKGQFNPAVSKKSQFSKEFVCPKDRIRWHMAVQAAQRAIRGEGNPFMQTPWEMQHGLSLVTGFYYPGSVQATGPLAPWEKSAALEFIGDIRIGPQTLSKEKIRFYRLTAPPGDIP